MIPRFLPQLALLGMVLRVTIPMGYMPAGIDGGWYLKLCPDAMRVVAAYEGGHHDQHQHRDHHDNSPEVNFHQCDLGGLTVDVTAESSVDTDFRQFSPVETIAALTAHHLSTFQVAFFPRGPPVLLT